MKNKVGISAPFIGWSNEGRSLFAIFFCVMIKREVFDEIGMLDDAFLVGAGEDTDFCIRAMDAGWKQVRVPKNDVMAYKPPFMVGIFPIWHKAGVTCTKVDGWSDSFEANRSILKERYGNRPVKINVECGADRKEGYVNIDASHPNADITFIPSDLTKFIHNDSIDEIHCSKFFSKFDPSRANTILADWYRVLKPDGKIVLEK